MIVERIWTGNAYRNFNYLVACPETGEALAIDPLDHEKCLHRAKVRGWQITQVLNTHEHHDHTGGNDAVIAATGAKLLAHHKSGAKIAGVDRDDPKVDRWVQRFGGHAISPERAAEKTLAGVARNRFLIYTSPDIWALYAFKRWAWFPYSFTMKRVNVLFSRALRPRG